MRAEIGTIVCFSILGATVATNEEFDNKFGSSFCRKIPKWFSFNPLCKVINDNHDVLSPPAHLSKGPAILIEMVWKANLGLTRLKLEDFARG